MTGFWLVLGTVLGVALVLGLVGWVHHVRAQAARERAALARIVAGLRIAPDLHLPDDHEGR